MEREGEEEEEAVVGALVAILRPAQPGAATSRARSSAPAAAAHGAAIQELEDTRKKLAEVENSRQADLVDQEKKMNERASAMLYSSSSREGGSRKRMHDEVAPDEGTKADVGIWDAMFNSMRQQNGRY